MKKFKKLVKKAVGTMGGSTYSGDAAYQQYLRDEYGIQNVRAGFNIDAYRGMM